MARSMIRIRKDQRGFTLLEVIIVIIIVGVLASLALPRFFSTVEYARGVEAMQAIATIRQSMERCYMMRRTYSGCQLGSTLDVENPQNSPGAHFTYRVWAWSNTEYQIQARRNTLDGGQWGGIVMDVDGATIRRWGWGAFSQIRQGF